VPDPVMKKSETVLLSDYRLAVWLVKNPLRKSFTYCLLCNKKFKTKKDLVRFNVCKHKFHKECLKRKKECPLCFELRKTQKPICNGPLMSSNKFAISLSGDHIFKVFDKRKKEASYIPMFLDHICDFEMSDCGRFLILECNEPILDGKSNTVKRYFQLFDLYQNNKKYTINCLKKVIIGRGILEKRFFVVGYKGDTKVHQIFDLLHGGKLYASVGLGADNYRSMDISSKGRFFNVHYEDDVSVVVDLQDDNRQYIRKKLSHFTCFMRQNDMVIEDNRNEDRYVVPIQPEDIQDISKDIYLRNDRFFMVRHVRKKTEERVKLTIFDLKDHCKCYTVWLKQKGIRELCFRKNRFFIARYWPGEPGKRAEATVFDLKDGCKPYILWFKSKHVKMMDIKDNRFCSIRYKQGEHEQKVELGMFDLQGEQKPYGVWVKTKKIAATLIINNRFIMIRYHDYEVCICDMQRQYKPYTMQIKEKKITKVFVQKECFVVISGVDFFVGNLENRKVYSNQLKKKQVVSFDIQHGRYFIARYIENEIAIFDVDINKIYTLCLQRGKTISNISIRDDEFASVKYEDGKSVLLQYKTDQESCTIL